MANIPNDIQEVLNSQSQKIEDLTEQVYALEFLLAQAMTVALRAHPDPHAIAQDLEAFFLSKGKKSGVDSTSGNKGFESGVRIFDSVKNSID